MISLLAGAMVLAAPGASAQHNVDLFAGDRRLQSKRTVTLRGETMRDALADVQQETGVPFFADKAVAGDRIVLYSHDRPVADALRAIAWFFHFDWKRTGPPGGCSYTLYQPVESRIAEQQGVAEHVNAVADAVLADLAQRETPSPAVPQQQAAARSICRELLAGANREQIVGLLTGPGENYSWPVEPGCRPLPDTIASAVVAMLTRPLGGTNQRAVRMYGPNGMHRQYNFATAGLHRGLGGPLALQLTLEAGYRGPSGQQTMAINMRLPAESATSVAVDSPEPAWQPVDAFNRKVTVDLSALAWTQLRDPAHPRQQAPALAVAVDRVEATASVDLISDCFWSTKAPYYAAYDRPLGETLSEIARRCGHKWWLQDGFAAVQDVDYAAARANEPPGLRMAAWMRALVNGDFLLDDLAEVAALPTDQMQTALAALSIEPDGEGLGSVGYSRAQLALWAKLSSSQRHAAQSSGLPYQSLSPELQAAFAESMRMRSPDGMPNGRRFWSLEDLRDATLYVSVEKVEGWEYTSRNGDKEAVWTQDRDEVLSTLKPRHPDVTWTHLAPVSMRRVSFHYRTPNRPEIWFPIALPIQR